MGPGRGRPSAAIRGHPARPPLPAASQPPGEAEGGAAEGTAGGRRAGGALRRRGLARGAGGRREAGPGRGLGLRPRWVRELRARSAEGLPGAGPLRAGLSVRGLAGRPRLGLAAPGWR